MNEAAWQDIVLPRQQLSELKKLACMFAERHPAGPQGTLLSGAPGTGKTLIAQTISKAVQCNFLRASVHL